MGFLRLGCCLLSVVLFLSISNIVYSSQDEEDRKVYIVYMGSLPSEDTLQTYSPTSHHLSLLYEVTGAKSSVSASASTSTLASASLVRSYSRSFNGFAAKLTQKEAEKLAIKEEVLSVFPSQTFHPQTTRSWDYLGLNKTAKRSPTVESDIIIGVLDTGLDPKAESFSDKGFGPPPKKWKGSCKGGANFTCNNKLIGAKNYITADKSAHDQEGHGTHTSSTAAGNAVDGASFFGVANGTAKGGVPSSRISMYRVCNPEGCASEWILAAFDDAIADGVDIITISIGGDKANPFDADPIAIGSFHAVAKGILVTHSAGNYGPGPESLTSTAPWVLTVAASSIDRQFISKLALADGTVFSGPAINGYPTPRKDFNIVYGKDATSSGHCSEDYAKNCYCLDAEKVAGKIVICNQSSGIYTALNNNASGMVLNNINEPLPGVARDHAIPAVSLANADYEKLLSYYKSKRNPRGRILRGETAPNPDSPVVISFSSRGPNKITPDIMKPDVTAPGINILAAFPPYLPANEDAGDERSVKFSFLSGTSMACPHAAGAAAYVKTFHPDWSPSAIKSALMTTASGVRNGVATGYEFSYGSGQINPVKAADPGLVYEITKDDYVNLLCSLGFNMKAIDSKSTCPKGSKKNMTQAELNYPSVTFNVSDSKPVNLTAHRTVTNVGPACSTYKAKVVSPKSLNITVVPDVLSFKSVSEKKSFSVKISGGKVKSGAHLSGEVVWSDGVHSVRSPIIVYAGVNRS